MRGVDSILLRKLRRALLGALVLKSLVLSPALSAGAGLPEPGLVLYGVIRNLDGRAPARMTAGPLTCRVTPPIGSPITLTTNLQDLNGQFSYVLTIPFETDIGVGLSANTLTMPASATNYSIEFFLANAPVRTATTRTFVFSRADRARQQRVDADFMVAFPDANANGLPDWWENLYFGGSANPAADADGDGLNNLAEYLAGTSPTDAQSALKFVSVEQNFQQQLVVAWSSVTNRLYSVLRSPEVMGDYSVIFSNLPATPPQNLFTDTNAAAAMFFYRVRVESP